MGDKRGDAALRAEVANVLVRLAGFGLELCDGAGELCGGSDGRTCDDAVSPGSDIANHGALIGAEPVLDARVEDLVGHAVPAMGKNERAC